MKRQNKAQSAVEFMILVGAIFFFILVFIFIVQMNLSDETKRNHQIVIEETALAIQDEVNLAYSSPDGYYREFDLAGKILSLDYSINFTGNSVFLKTEDDRYTVSLPIRNFTGTVFKGENYIRKQGGIVYINQ